MTFKKSIFTILLQLLFLAVYSQRLPKVQAINLRAPVNANVDGKPTEWGKMQAYNPVAEIFYTIANDDKKLYLVVQSKERDMILRLVNGGVTLLIQKSGKKSDNGAVGAKFPFIEKGQNIGISANKDTENGKREDVTATNKSLSTKIKWMYTKGLLGKDSLLSVYNDVGILARNAISVNGIYTSELAIDLRLLGLSTSNNIKFAYHIIINGEPNRHIVTFAPEKWTVKSTDGTTLTEAQVQAAKQSMRDSYTAFSSTSDFWGEYTLAK